MRIAYLVTTYPHVSHSFVRREIAALEGIGASVNRFSIRASAAELVDPADRNEWHKTRCILSAGIVSLLIDIILIALAHPFSFVRSILLTWRLGYQSHRGLLRHIAYLAEACRLLRWLQVDGVEHLHAHFATNSATVAMLCKVLGGPPYSFTAHGTEAFDAPAAIGLNEKVRRAQFVIAVCDHGRSQICRWSAPADWHKVHVIRCGVDQSFLAHPRTQVPAVPRLVVVARFGPEKGHLVLLEAAAQLLREGLEHQLVLVGDGPMRREIEASVRRLRLDRCVSIIGWKSGEDVRNAILASRALVLPSFAEGLPVVIMEAFALGRPVISTYVAGIPELVMPNISGWLVPAGSVESLGAAMREALMEPVGRLGEMGQQGREKVFQNHDVNLETAKLAVLFRQAVEQKKARACPNGHDKEHVVRSICSSLPGLAADDRASGQQLGEDLT
jgi:colanic acid/amylovoran biosynthesis glycosyltransferase